MKIRLGDYTLRNGNFITLTEYSTQGPYCWIGRYSNGIDGQAAMCWTLDGSFFKAPGIEAFNDIVAEGHVKLDPKPIKPIKLADYPYKGRVEVGYPSHKLQLELPDGQTITVMVPTFANWPEKVDGKVYHLVIAESR
jgi:hypothetical protein